MTPGDGKAPEYQACVDWLIAFLDRAFDDDDEAKFRWIWERLTAMDFAWHQKFHPETYRFKEAR